MNLPPRDRRDIDGEPAFGLDDDDAYDTGTAYDEGYQHGKRDAEAGPATRNRVEDLAFTISQGIIGWADEDKTGERYPIPPWTVYVAIAKEIAGEDV